MVGTGRQAQNLTVFVLPVTGNLWVTKQRFFSDCIGAIQAIQTGRGDQDGSKRSASELAKSRPVQLLLGRWGPLGGRGRTHMQHVMDYQAAEGIHYDKPRNPKCPHYYVHSKFLCTCIPLLQPSRSFLLLYCFALGNRSLAIGQELG